jgi:hypothetical protein
MRQKWVFIPIDRKQIRVISVNEKNQLRKITEILFFIVYIRTPTEAGNDEFARGTSSEENWIENRYNY